jgi:hypothetical protein
MRSRRRHHHFYIPEKILNVLQDLVELMPHIEGFSIGRLKYLITLIVTHKQDKHPGAYSLLNMENMCKAIPHANHYLNFLKEMGVIEWKNYSAEKGFSRLYRITKNYDGNIQCRNNTDNYLIRRIEKINAKLKLQNSKKYPILNKYANLVNIDVAAAHQTIEKTYQENIISEDPKKRLNADYRRTYSLAEVEKIHTGQIRIKVNTTNNRYNSNFTRLPRELVQHLTINGKPLDELDVRNSQPFFAIGLFDPSPEIQKIMGKFFTMSAKNLKLHDTLDFKMYRLLVVKAKFYDFMKEQFTLNGIPYTEDDFKDQIFQVFYDKNRAIHYRDAVKLFERLFPNVYELFALIKKNDHALLPNLITKIESFVMLDRVAPKIIKVYPSLEFITKHDSLLPAGIMITGEVDRIVPLMRDEIGKVIGFSPEIKIKIGRVPLFYSKSNSFHTHTTPLSIMLRDNCVKC